MSNSMTPLRVALRVSPPLCIVLLLLTGWAPSAQNQEHRVRIRGLRHSYQGWL
jgi:hypothetical protein